MPTRNKIVDLFFLIGTAVIVCVIGGGAFVIAELRHMNPLWVFFSLISIGFLAGAWEDYSKELKSLRFSLFVLAWLAINIEVVVMVLPFGWLYLIPVLLLEQFPFYMSAYWIFGIEPRRRRSRS